MDSPGPQVPPLTEPMMSVAEAERSGFTLRPWLTEDAPALVAAWHDPDVARFTAVPDDPSPAVAQRWIAGWERRRDQRLALDLVIGRPGADGPDSVLGEVGLGPFSKRLATAHVGYWVRSDARGCGIATAALGRLLEHAVDQLRIPGFIARVEPGNPASEVVLDRNGFRETTPGVWARGAGLR